MSKADKIYILLFSILNIILHIAFAENLEYHRDELLYFSLGNHPSTGYYSVPPLIGWIAHIMKNIFGSSALAVRFFPALLSGFLVYITALSAKELGGKTFAIVASCLGIIFMPVTLRAFHLFQPVPIDMFLWTLILYLTIRYFKEKNDHFLIYLGIAVGISFLNKYLPALLVISLLISFLLSKQRSIFTRKYLYLSLLISLIIFSPNFIWQFNHSFPVFSHMAELNEQQLVNVNRISFLTDQLLMSFTFSIYIIAGFIYFLLHKKYRFISLTALMVIGILLVLRGKSYYSIGLFPILLAGGSVFFEKRIKNRAKRLILIIAPILLTIPIIPIGIPVFKQNGMVKYFKVLEEQYGLIIGRRFEDGTTHSLPQDYADQLGWKEMVSIIASAYEEIPDKNKALIYSENYGQAGAISVIGKKYNLPDPVSFDESFIYWAPQSFTPDIEYFIYVNDELGEDVASLFKTIINMGEVTNIHAREYGTTVYLCSNPNSSFNNFWKEVLAHQ